MIDTRNFQPLHLEATVIAAGRVAPPPSDPRRGSPRPSERLRVTVNLVPVACAKANALTIDGADLLQLPKALYRTFANAATGGSAAGAMTIAVLPISALNGTLVYPPVTNSIFPYSFTRPDDTTLTRISELWQTLIVDFVDAKVSFPSTNGASSSGQGTAQTPRESEKLAHILEALGSAPATPPDFKPGTSALPNARTDAAMLHVLARAEQLVKRINDDIAPARPEAPASEAVEKIKEAREKFINSKKNVKDYQKGAGELKKEILSIETKSPQVSTKIIEKQIVDMAKWVSDVGETRKGPPNQLPKNPPYPWSIQQLRNASKRKELLAIAQELHWAAMVPDAPRGAADADTAAQGGQTAPGATAAPDNLSLPYIARLFWFLVQNSPTLSRVFGLTFDLLIDVPAGIFPPTSDVFVALGLNTRREPDARVDDIVLTLAKLSRISVLDKEPIFGFWPATRQEVPGFVLSPAISQPALGGLPLPVSQALSQRDGLINLGQELSFGGMGTDTGSQSYPRYDVVTIDPTQACENYRRAQTTIADTAESQGLPALGTIDEMLVTRGLVICDRWRAAEIARDMSAHSVAHSSDASCPPATMPQPTSQKRILDANDLTLGYRVNATIRVRDRSQNEWRSLMEREISYHLPSEPKGQDQFDSVFHKLRLVYETDARRHLDAAHVLPVGRMRIPHAEEKKAYQAAMQKAGLCSDPIEEIVHGEEILASWQDDPLGLQCGEAPITLEKGQGLAISQSFDLPKEDNEKAFRAYEVRFGWSYALSLSPVWVGGVSMPISEVERRCNWAMATEQNLTLPTTPPGKFYNDKPVAPFRRLLRHEPVGVPVVLLPYHVALEDTPYLRQSATRVLLRTQFKGKCIDGKDDTRTLDTTWRVILPPRLSLADVIRHGVFDPLPANAPPPAETMSAIDYGGMVCAMVADRPADGNGPSASPVLMEKQRRGFAQVSRRRTTSGELYRKDSEPSLEEIFGKNKIITPCDRNGVKKPDTHASSAEKKSDTNADANADATREEVFHLRTKKRKYEWGDGDIYFPDPMASRLCLAARQKETRVGQGYFDGEPLVLDILSGANGKPLPYGEFRPVILCIRRSDGGNLRGHKPTQKELFSSVKVQAITDADLKNNLKPRSSGSPAGAMTCYVVEVTLAAGEDVEIDCWFAPTAVQLRQVFDLPETLVVAAMADLDHRTPSRNPNDVIGTLKQRLDPKKTIKETPAADLNKVKNEPAFMGALNMPVYPAALVHAAHMLAAQLGARPLPQIASAVTLSCLHAVDKPLAIPELAGKPDAPTKPLMIVMRGPASTNSAKVVESPPVKAPTAATAASSTTAQKDTTADDALYVRRERLCKAADAIRSSAGELPPELSYGEPNDAGLIVAGYVKVDPDTVRQLEVRAYGTTPAIGALDDVRLGRTPTQIMFGSWEEKLLPPEDFAAKSCRSDAVISPALSRSARYIYGFDVDEEGRVTFRKNELTLLTVDLPSPSQVGRLRHGMSSGPMVIDLTQLQIDRLPSRQPTQCANDSASPDVARLTPLDVYADTLARRLTLSIRAIARHDAYFLRREWLRQDAATDKTPDFSPVPESYYPPNRKDVDAIRSSSRYNAPAPFNEITVWVPATIAPAKPQVLTPTVKLHARGLEALPLLAGLKPSKDTIAFNAMATCPTVCVEFERPWGSSGEGERVGIVVWPPRLRELSRTACSIADLDAGKVPRAALGRGKLSCEDVMDLSDFKDEDLGPGGRFTSRWGADPIRTNVTPLGPFLPWSALDDIKDIDSGSTDDDDAPGYVGSVAIPLNDPRSITNDEETKQEWFQAGLATYTPRFNVETEKWFVDLRLRPGSAVEPFLRLGLVRYQPHAAEELRVSAPVSTVARVWPERQCVVWATPLPGSPHGIRVFVQVAGVYALTLDGSSSPRPCVAPSMRIRIEQRKVSASGLETSEDFSLSGEMVVTEQLVKPGKPINSKVCLTPEAWVAVFDLPQIDVNTHPKLSIVVEEIEQLPSAANQVDKPRALPDKPPVPKPSSTSDADGGAPSQFPLSGDAETTVAPVAAMRETGPKFIAILQLQL